MGYGEATMTRTDRDPYRRIARFYDGILEPVNAPLRAIGLKMHPPDNSMSVLDVGCGTGAHLAAYVEAGADCHGIDTSPAMLERAHARIGDRANLQLGDAVALPHEESSFDLVVTSLFLHELDVRTRDAALAEMARVVKPDGRVLVIDYRAGPLRMKGRVTRTLVTVAERVAGRDHYRNWRVYLGQGGLPAVAAKAGLIVEREKIVSGGNLALWLLKAAR